MRPDSSDSLVFGERVDGTIVHISEVASGLACGCRCPGCGAPLVARKGELIDHHFGHHRAAEGFSCQTGSETALHKFAKECLARRLELALPAWEAASSAGSRQGYPGGVFQLDVAILERRLGGIVPDVIARRKGRDLLVEFRVAHPCDAAKIAKLVELNMAAVEIDLSWAPRDVSRAGLEEAVLKEAPRRWLHNPKFRAHAPSPENFSPPKPSAATHLASMVRAYRAACAEVQALPVNSLAADRIVTSGLSHAIGIAVPGCGCFAVAPSDWQATILEQVLDRALAGGRPVITPADALRQLKQRDWVRSRFLRLTTAEATVLSGIEPSFARPAEAISAWAMAAAWSGILIPAGGSNRWALWPGTISMVRDVRRSGSATMT